ncbi:MAG TPA: P-loop NTPase fold protein [Thermoanaerobaculia bacterium]
MRVKYLPDRPVRTSAADLLSFEAAAKGALGHIAATEPPFTWGIFGDWGSGKTSLMRLIEQQMEARLKDLPQDASIPLHIPVWFDAWRYENEVNIVYPLFHAIRRDFEQRCKNAADSKSFFDSFKKVATASLLGLTDLALRAATNKAFGEAVSLKEVGEHLKRAEDELQTVFDKWSDTIIEVQEDFERFVRAYIEIYCGQRPELEGRRVYLAIFIDDLDRCLPDVAITILERVKNHLSVENCLFVLGINRYVVYQSIRKKYQDLDIDGRQHLEKIIQYSMGVPEPKVADLASFVVKSIEGLLTEAHDPDLTPYFDDFANALYDCGFTNPRKIKRILNRYLSFLERHVTKADLAKYQIPTVTRLIVMREYYHDLYQLFNEKGFQPFAQIKDYNGGEESAKKFVDQYGKKWQPLIASFERFKRFANMDGGRDITEQEYDRSIRELFGRED